jgi:hypothetical protein
MSVAELSQAQRERLAHLELRLFFTGELRRADIESRFGVKPAAASRDISLYRELAPRNLQYDLTQKVYVATPDFAPVFEMRPDRVLSWLAHGFGDGLELGLKQQAPFDSPQNFFVPNLATLAALTRAICARKAISMNYSSASSGITRREVVPVALADSGLRLHMRAFDRKKKVFGDFVVTRIDDVVAIEGTTQEHELIAADDQWTRMVELHLVAHPQMNWPQAAELDYGIIDGVLRVKTRAAMAGYVLRRWSVDASPDHNLDPSSHHLWLKNPKALYGVESAVLAPGFLAERDGE